MGGMPFDATHEQIDNIQQQLAEAARAQDALKSPGNQVAFVDNYKQLTGGGKREDGFPMPQIEEGVMRHDPKVVAELSRIGREQAEKANQTYPGPEGTRQNGYKPNILTGGEFEQGGHKHDGFPIPGSERTGNQRFDGFPTPNVDNQKTGIEIGNDVNVNLKQFGAKIENGKLHLVNGKQINVLGNTEKISVTSYMQEKRLDGDTYMTLRVDNKDGTHQLAHFATGPNGDELVLEKNGFKTTVYDIDKTKLKGPEIGSDVNTGLKTFGASIENGRLNLTTGQSFGIDNKTSKISVLNYAQSKMLDGPANMTLRVDNNDGTFQLAHFSKGPNGEKLVFEKNGVQTTGYNIPRS